ncbi:Na(+)/H(+) antiporter NhaB [compost metagenome]
MVWMALPYTLVLGLVGFFAVEQLLAPATEWFYQAGWLTQGSAAMQTLAPAAH